MTDEVGCPHPPEHTRSLFSARDYITGEAFEVTLCRACGLACTSPRPADQRMAAYYPDGYYGTAASRRFPAAAEYLQRLLYARRARSVEKLAGGAPGRVLDIGCGRGHLLDAFRRRGWQPHGTELLETSARHAREVLGIPVEVGPSGAWPWPNGHFDAVVLWHVLEHWPDPHATLLRAAGLLRPGGVLMIGVPNFASLEARLARGKWFHLDVPRHLAHMTDRWLAAELARAGCEVRRVSFSAPEYDCFSFVQTGLNLLGLKQNALYDMLRGRAAKVLGGVGWVDVLGTALGALPLAVASAPATALLAAVGQGSSVTMQAVKRGT